MEPIHIVLHPHSQTQEDYPHEGEEFGYVMSGEINVHLNKKVYRCKKGESFYFVSDKVHYIENVKDKDAVVIWVSSPPSF